MRKPKVICALLILLTWALYWPAYNCGFVNYDDDRYVTENPHINHGLSLSAVIWAFTKSHFSMWHPLTSISHMVDCQLFGLHAGPHHLVNVLFHGFSAGLLGWLLYRMTGCLWRSATVAALFAWHPLRVESVAWIAERKDVLCTFFWLLTTLVYLRYTEKPNRARYAVLLGVFALAILTKPMMVTLPFALLLLDVWPLKRLPFAGVATQETWPQFKAALPGLLREKIPLFALSLFLAVMTYHAQNSGGIVAQIDHLPLFSRVGNAVVAYATYLEMLVWPLNLAVFYPHPGTWPLARIIGSLAVFGGLSVAVVLQARRYPYLLVGWCWYLGVLVPAIGLVQVGEQSMADRYTYLPSVGIFILLVWGAADAAWRGKLPRWLGGAATVLVLLAAMFLTTRQLSVWKDSVTLFTHALKVTTKNPLAENNLAAALLKQNRLAEAIPHIQVALRIRPGHADAWVNLGLAAEMYNKNADAISDYREAVRIDPKYQSAYVNLGAALAAQGEFAEAIKNYHRALQLQPEDAAAHFNLGAALEQTGQASEAQAQYEEAIALKPHYAKAQNNLAALLVTQGRLTDALPHYQLAVQADPALLPARYNLGVALNSLGRAEEAVAQFAEIIRLAPNYPNAHYRLAALYQRQGKTADAQAQLRDALRVKADSPAALNLLARLLATSSDAHLRNGAEAVALAEKAAQLTHHQNGEVLDTLAAAYAETGDFAQAATTEKQALQMALATHQPDLIAQLQNRLQLYEQGQPWHETRK